MTKISLSRAWEETKAVLAADGRLMVSVALALFVLPGLILDVTVPATPPNELPTPGPWIAVALVAVLVSFVGQLSVIRLATGPHVSVGEAIAHGFRRLPFYVCAFLLWAAPLVVAIGLLYGKMGANAERPAPAAALGVMLLSALGVFLAVRLILTSAVASLESANPLEILRRGWALTAGNWWRLFAFMLLVGVGAIALLAAVASVTALLARLLFGDVGPMTVGGLLVAIVSQVLSAFFSVFFFTMIARLYRQLTGGGEAQASVPSSGI